MQTIDQGFTVDHPLVGMNTGNLDRNIYKINEPGEAVLRNGQRRAGMETNSQTTAVTGTLTSSQWNESAVNIASLNMADDYGTTPTAALGVSVIGRARLKRAWDYAPVTGTVTDGAFTLGKVLLPNGYVEDVTWTQSGLTYSNSTSVIPSTSIVSACLVRSIDSNSYPTVQSGDVVYATTDGAPGATAHKLYLRTGGISYLISQVASTTYDIAPHLCAYYHGGRWLIQSALMDANGPEYCWTTNNPGAGFTQLAYGAWISISGVTGTTLRLFCTERTTAGRNQVGSSITITNAGVLTETATVPEVGYTQGADAFNGPGFYSSLFTDTAGGADIQAMTGNGATAVNTQSAGTGIVETILPDTVGYQLIPSGVQTTFCKIKTANKQPAFLTLSTGFNADTIITEYGKFCLSYLPAAWYSASWSTTMVWFYAISPYEFEIVMSCSSPNENKMQSMVRNGFDIYYGDNGRITDFTNNRNATNYGGFVRCCVAYREAMGGVGANTISIQPGNRYNNGVFLGSYTGVASAAHPARLDWLDMTAGDYYVYHSAATNGQARVYTLRQSGITGVSHPRYIETDYLDSPMASFVQNDNLPIPAGSKIDAGIVKLPTGIAKLTQFQSDLDGSIHEYFGYTLTNYLEIEADPFVIQGQIYAYDGVWINAIASSAAGLGTPEPIVKAVGLRLLTVSANEAFFARDYDDCIVAFNGARDIVKFADFTGLKIAGYTSATGSAIANIEPQNYGLNTRIAAATYHEKSKAMWVRLSRASTSSSTYFVKIDESGTALYEFAYRSSPNATGMDDWHIINRSTAVLFVQPYNGSVNSGRYYVYSGGTVSTLDYQSPYYGYEEGHYATVLKYVLRVKVADAATTNIVINYKWFTYDSSGNETYTFSAGAYTASSGYAYLEYTPTQQLVHGASIGLTCTKEISIISITGHYGAPQLALSVNQNTSTA